MEKPISTMLFLLLGMTISFAQKAPVPEPEFADQIYLLTSDAECRKLPRKSGIIKSKAGASSYLVDIGKVKTCITLSGPTSFVTIPVGRDVRFITRAANDLTDSESFINIFPFEVKGKGRRAQLAEAGTLSATRTNSLGQISFKAKKYRQSSYYIAIENLKPGEYGTSLGDPDKRNEKNSMEITTFSVK